MKYERASEISKGVVPFAPVPQRPSSSDALDNAGQNVLTLLQQAADISEQNSQHALDIAHKLSVQLRAAEDRNQGPGSRIIPMSKSRGSRGKMASSDFSGNQEALFQRPGTHLIIRLTSATDP
jgi:hypothetical protein